MIANALKGSKLHLWSISLGSSLCGQFAFDYRLTLPPQPPLPPLIHIPPLIISQWLSSNHGNHILGAGVFGKINTYLYIT